MLTAIKTWHGFPRSALSPPLPGLFSSTSATHVHASFFSFLADHSVVTAQCTPVIHGNTKMLINKKISWPVHGMQTQVPTRICKCSRGTLIHRIFLPPDKAKIGPAPAKFGTVVCSLSRVNTKWSCAGDNIKRVASIPHRSASTVTT